MATTADIAEQTVLDLIGSADSAEVLSSDEFRGRLKVAYSLMPPEAVARVRMRVLQRRAQFTSDRESGALRAVLDSIDKPAWEVFK
jgi:hypothetical protein